jgi:monofunctional glycosyltransferase
VNSKWSLPFFAVLLSFMFGCTPELKLMRTHYAHVKYLGPKKPFDVVITKVRPSDYVSISDISQAMQGAVIVSEDWTFYQHEGFDPHEMKEALKDSIEEGHLTRGASTITQQVARNVYLSQERSLIRKIRELWIASKMEKILTKKKILEIYLNIVELGEGVFGVGPAARYYFDKHPRDLLPKEAAFLAMLLPSPKKYSVSFRKKQLTPFAKKIITSILVKMEKAGYITEIEHEIASAEKLTFEYRSSGSDTLDDAATLEDEELD